MNRIIRIAGICVAALVLATGSAAFGSELAGQFPVTGKIVGGTEATPGQWPWMGVMVKAGGSLYENEMCGASLIGKRWVITAAHCVYGRSPSSIEIVFGVHNLKTDTGDRFGVKQIVVHPDFNNSTLDSDIALLELDEDCGYETIPIIGKDLTLTGYMATVLGWGSTSSSQSVYPATLQQVTMPIVSNVQCNSAYNTLPYYYNSITATMMCSGYLAGGKDSCQGDSGGPLMVEMEGEWQLAGLVTWGEGCAEPGFYGVYTRVSKFIDYINAITIPEQLSVYIPHITSGADDWKDFVQVDNNTSQSCEYTLDMYSSGSMVYSHQYTIPALGKNTLDLKAIAPAAASGKISYTDPGLHFRYSIENLTGGGVSEYNMPVGLASSLVFYYSDVLPVVEWKSLALANMSEVSARVTLSAIAQGVVVGEATVTVLPRSKVIGQHSQWFQGLPVSQFVRILATSSNASLCGISVSGNMDAATLVLMPAVSAE
ncbi:MAG: serine protease [Pseudomonadota bacterium]